MRKLDASHVVKTAERLRARIVERFPDATLNRTAESVVEVATRSVERTAEIAKPNILLRVLIAILIAAIPVTIGYELWTLDLSLNIEDLGEAIALFQATVESIIFIGLGILFLVSLEVRTKRSRALRALHELSELAHLVDMHQLDKDPGYLIEKGKRTPSSPERKLDSFQMHRYLDYCSEMLSLIGKVAALYAQTFADPVALDAADRLESLTTGLARKIWQKVMILERAAPGSAPVN
jgi:hypothetical protein